MKKKIGTDKSWWVKMPSGIYEAMKHAVADKSKVISALGIFTVISIVYANRRYSRKEFLRLSVIKAFLGLTYSSRVKQLEAVLENPWLFHSRRTSNGKDLLVKPVIDVGNMSETRVNDILQTIRNQDYEQLLVYSPNTLLSLKEDARGLFFSDPDQAYAETYADANAYANARADAEAYAGSNAGARVIEREREREKENDIIRKEENKGTIVGQDVEPGFLSFSERKNGEDGLPDISFAEYVGRLELGSKEVDNMLKYAGSDEEFLRAHFGLFKELVVRNVDAHAKDKELDGATYNGQNLYVCNLLRKGVEREKLVKDMRDKLVVRRKRDKVYGAPGFPHDFFNLQGQRVSGRRIVPDDAPPRPSDEHFWDGERWLRR